MDDAHKCPEIFTAIKRSVGKRNAGAVSSFRIGLLFTPAENSPAAQMK
jgi:hypothetical protein